MRKQIFTLLTIFILVLSGISVASSNIEKDKINQISETITLPLKTFELKDEYLSVKLEGINTYLIESGKPKLPVLTYTYTFPVGTKILDVECEPTEQISQEIISHKIIPAPSPQVNSPYLFSSDQSYQQIKEDGSVYTSSEPFPSTWFDYNIGIGLDKEISVIYLNIRIYPIRYLANENKIFSLNDFNLKITYEQTDSTDNSNDEYDMVIIAPRRFSFVLQPLIKHKNNMGVKTTLKTTETIYSEYNGRDKPEKIKYYIKDAIETTGIKYVLLFGGRIGQRYSWYVPVRYSHTMDNDWYYNESCYISDLYYSDVYKIVNNEKVFDDWDSNGNGVFGEWSRDNQQKDVLDMYPDVYVGRLACRSTFEAYTVVKKIINYEKYTNGKDWFKTLIVAGGDTVPTDDDDYEGEIVTQETMDIIQPLGFNNVRLWASDGTLKNHFDVIPEINKGAGFIHFSGHGDPLVWSTHLPHSEYDEWLDALHLRDMNVLINRNKLPVVVVGGCHNSEFDVTTLNFFTGILQEGLHYFSADENDLGSFFLVDWPPECWSWRIISRRNGGAIATIGNTALGFCYPGEYILNGLGGWLETRFFDAYANQSIDNLGMAHSQALTDYINIIGGVYTDRVDRKTLEEWVLLGDPSLKIGGYSS